MNSKIRKKGRAGRNEGRKEGREGGGKAGKHAKYKFLGYQVLLVNITTQNTH